MAAPQHVTMYCDASDHCYRGNTHHCIAGVILEDTQKVILDTEINSLKRRYWGEYWDRNPEKVEIKGTDITDKRKCFRRLSTPRMRAFLEELWEIIFDGLELKVLPFYAQKSYTLFLNHYNNYLVEQGITGKIIFDEGDDNFKKLVRVMKEKEAFYVFDTSSRIRMTKDEIDHCLVDSRKENALQIADLFAYTTAFFSAMTHAEKEDRPGFDSFSVVPAESFDTPSGRLDRSRIPLPLDKRLEKSYVKQPHDLMVTLRPSL